jgi:hypothetical protein
MDTLRDYMYNDIQGAIKVDANYLAALGLSSYTEHLGGLYLGDLTSGNSKKNYTGFIMDFFPGSMYKTVDTQLQSLGGLYKVVRCGLVHEYFMKAYSAVSISGSSSNCGISYDIAHKPHLEFYVDVYFNDFKSAFEKYYDELIKGPSSTLKKLREQNFDGAIGKMPLQPFQSSFPSSSHLRATSGSSSSVTLKGPP